MDSKTLVEKIIDSNKHIRFAAIFDMDSNIVASKEREGVSRMLSQDDTKKWAHIAVNAWNNRTELYPKIGEGKYVLAVYRNLKRITMPVDKNHLLYVTFDSDGGQEDIIQAVLNQKPGFGSGGLTS
jgi:hypothetical protein